MGHEAQCTGNDIEPQKQLIDANITLSTHSFLLGHHKRKKTLFSPWTTARIVRANGISPIEVNRMRQFCEQR